jgi:PAS domain S-box-containing protein
METVGLIISCIVVFMLIFYLSTLKKKNQLQKIFLIDSIILFAWCLLLLAQKYFCANYNINPIVFEWFIYIFACFLPVSLLFTGIIFANTRITFKKKYILLFIIPITSLILLWTNNLHHLFYVNYSTNVNETIFGNYFYIHSTYGIILYAIALIYFLKYSIKNSGIFSKQAILIVIGCALPITVNILSFFNIIDSTIYITPICFSFTILCCALAIFKFDFLKVTPIALQKIVDRMSDSYIILNENYVVTDFNETFLTTFHLKATEVRNKDFCKLITSEKSEMDKLILTLDKAKHSSETFTFERHFTKLDKYFNIEINNITNKGSFLGILILFKDITQHKKDMDTIRENQDLLVEKERLASLGQLVGGIAHNLKTPIMSISGAAEGLTDLVKEYDSSIGDPEVNEQDHHEIAHDMNEWIEKIKTHASYMSDVITAVKGQAVTLNEQEQDNFTIQELIKRVTILMKHELKNALIDLNVDINTDDMTTLNGNVNSLVQVINNMISNAIQSYNGQTNKTIDLTVNKENSKIIISIQDYGCGMNNEVKEKLFKEMFTTKGKNGTGLGMFMSYSTIRGHFNGNITFDSEVGKGTRFDITLPL